MKSGAAHAGIVMMSQSPVGCSRSDHRSCRRRLVKDEAREAVVHAIVVDGAHRRGGVGRTLMAAAEGWGEAHNCRAVVLSSNVTRAPAHAFYERLGYGLSASSCIFRRLLA